MNFDAAQNTAINNEHLGIGSVIELLIFHFSDGSKTFYSSDDDTRLARGALETTNSNIYVILSHKKCQRARASISKCNTERNPLAYGLFRIQDIDIPTCLWVAAA